MMAKEAIKERSRMRQKYDNSYKLKETRYDTNSTQAFLMKDKSGLIKKDNFFIRE